MYAEAYIEPIQTSVVELLCENHIKYYCICSTGLGSKYASGKGFTVAQVYRMSISSRHLPAQS